MVLWQSRSSVAWFELITSWIDKNLIIRIKFELHISTKSVKAPKQLGRQPTFRQAIHKFKTSNLESQQMVHILNQLNIRATLNILFIRAFSKAEKTSIYFTHCNISPVIWLKKGGYLESFPGVLEIGKSIDFDVFFRNFNFITSYLCRSRLHFGKMVPNNSFLTISHFRFISQEKYLYTDLN